MTKHGVMVNQEHHNRTNAGERNRMSEENDSEIIEHAKKLRNEKEMKNHSKEAEMNRARQSQEEEDAFIKKAIFKPIQDVVTIYKGQGLEARAWRTRDSVWAKVERSSFQVLITPGKELLFTRNPSSSGTSRMPFRNLSEEELAKKIRNE